MKRLIRTALVALVLPLTGCAIDSNGNLRWTGPTECTAPEAADFSWNGHYGEPLIRTTILDLRPRLDARELSALQQ